MRREMAVQHGTSLAEAREWLDGAIGAPEGAFCPCCRQPDQIHQRRIAQATVERLFDLYRYSNLNGRSFHHVSDFVTDHTVGRDVGILRFIGLLERAPGPTDSGLYRITQHGCDFIEGRVSIPQVLVIYHDELLEALGPDRVITGFWQGFRPNG